MPFEIRTGPRGPSPLWDGRQLASAYDPAREALAWAETRGTSGSLVFVAGDPLGLGAQALEARGIRTAVLLPGAAARPYLPPGLTAWAPEEGDIEPFLQTVFDRWGPDAVSWEVWPAFERLAPETALDWGLRFRDFYRTIQGSWLTQKRFGRQFWRNSLRNYLDWNRRLHPTPGDRPVVIAASGPSLDEGLGLLAQDRGAFDLWALPSSIETLVRRGIRPDAAVATDGGYYAREHLQRLAGTSVPVLAALSSAADPVLSQRPCYFFSQGMPIERALLEARGGPVPEVPSQGTVAVTALRLALEATRGPVLIAGLDLAFRDLRGHTSPHTVDRQIEARAGRLEPAEGLWAQRTLAQATVLQAGVRTSPALLTYAGWFRTRARFSRPVYQIAPTAVRWDSMAEVSWDQARGLWRTPGSRPVTWTEGEGGTRESRRRDVEGALDRLGRRVTQSPEDDPWLLEAAQTAVPEAVEEAFRQRRRGQPGSVKDALVRYLGTVKEDLW